MDTLTCSIVERLTSPDAEVRRVAVGALSYASDSADASWWSMLGDLKDRTLAGYDKLGKPSVNDRQVLGREAVVGAFMGSVKVEQVRGSRLVRVTATILMLA